MNNSIESVINNVYNSMINVILSGMKEENFDEIKIEYKRILLNRYSDLAISNVNYDNLYNKIYKLEYNEWNAKPVPMKAHILLKDKNLNEIINIANNGYSAARSRLTNGMIMSKEVADDGIKKMNELYGGVKDCNQKLAEWHISEGTVDLRYASGQTDSMSLRMGRMK